MLEHGPDVRLTIATMALPQRVAVGSGIEATRAYLHEAGASGGLSWLPRYGRLYRELQQSSELYNTVEYEDDTTSTLISSFEQAYAATTTEARQRDSQRHGEGYTRLARAKALAVDMQWRALVPPVMESLVPLQRVGRLLHGERLFAKVYAEELVPGERYQAQNLHCDTLASQVTPELLDRLGATSIHELPGMLQDRGVQQVTLSTLHTARQAPHSPMRLPGWESYWEDFASCGLVREVTVALYALAKRRDTPEHKLSRQLGDELKQEVANPAKLGPLPEQLATVVSSLPAGSPLDICVSGNVASLRPPELKNVFRNLAALAQV